MKTLNHTTLIALFATTIIASAALTGCGSDPPVSTAGDEGGGGSGSDTGGTGGMPGEGQCYDGNGNNCGSGGSGTTTGKNWTTYSFDVFQNDPYNTWGFIDSQAQDFLSCYMSASCKKKMDSNDPSTRFQRLGDGNYEENYSGNMGCYVVARSASDCGYNLQLQSGTEGLLWGKVYLSAGNDGQEFKTQKALVGYNSGDKCAPGAVVVCSENAFTLKQFASGTKP